MTNLQVGIVAEIVIQLLGRPGIDLAMVKSLESDEEHSTDRLMLSSLESDLAIVDWRSAEQTLASLATLGVDVCRAPFALDPAPSAVAPGVRRVYVIDLRNAFKPDEVVEALMTLLKQRQVVTVSLAGLKPAIPKSNPSPEPVKLQPTKPMNTSPSIPAQSSKEPNNSQPHRPNHTNDDAALDALVNSVNDIDL